MTTILFITCFALLALAFFLIILLYLKMTQLKEIEIKQERLLKEFENVITSYVMEIKEDNEVFLNRIQQVQQTPNKSAKRGNIDISELDGENKESIQIIEPDLTTEDIQDLLPAYAKQNETEQITISEIESTQKKTGDTESNEDVIVKDIDHLIKLGLTYEDIAKKLNKGQTEIELLHKFRQNN
ncbi:hypothetical protein [Fredinandcohnia onubensis]|uniref:hypothetical protein n=1 Tax=Fredinandcohnia onubensis TaxID=1571209 RepID=UPI000C0BF5BF|nr:hypothetical protein [Fredinandcohnia onubensis]